MPFSHHSHSGQFCEGHAKNSLEDIIQTAIAKKMRVFALSEHMPREEQDFYPEEVSFSLFAFSFFSPKIFRAYMRGIIKDDFDNEKKLSNLANRWYRLKQMERKRL